MVRLGDVCEIIAGQSPEGANYTGDPSFVEFHQGCKAFGNKFLESSGIYTKVVTKIAKSGSILMSVRAPVGTLNITQRDVCIGRGLAAFNACESLNQDYLYFCLLAGNENLNKVAGAGTVFPSISRSQLASFTFPLPPPPVQREIVARLEKELGEADALAAKFKEIAENADAEFKAELDETFKGLDGARNCFETSCCMKRGEYITRKEARCGNIPVILGGKEPAYFIDRSNHDGECLVISRSGASAGFVSYWNEPIFVTDGFIIEVKENADIRFAYYYYQSLYEQLGKSKNGSAIPHVTGSGIQALGFPGTSLLVQKEIVTKLDAVREKCEKLKVAAERGLRAAEDLRKAILAEAFEQ